MHGSRGNAKSTRAAQPLAGERLSCDQSMSGGVLLSHRASPAVPSALKGLTSGFGMGPGVSLSLWPPKRYGVACPRRGVPVSPEPHSGREIASRSECKLSPRPISTGQLHALRRFHFRPINPVVYWGPYQVNPVGAIILRRASRLDAFSGYPFQTWPTSRALGRTTGTPEVCPSRSSRTRDSPSQGSCARSG